MPVQMTLNTSVRTNSKKQGAWQSL